MTIFYPALLCITPQPLALVSQPDDAKHLKKSFSQVRKHILYADTSDQALLQAALGPTLISCALQLNLASSCLMTSKGLPNHMHLRKPRGLQISIYAASTCFSTCL